MDASLRTSRLKDRVLYSNTLLKQLLVNQGRLASWRNPQTTAGSMAELIDVIKGELVTTPAEQQAVIDLSIPATFSLELIDFVNTTFMTLFRSVNTTPDLNNLAALRNIEIVSPLNVGPFTPTNPNDLDGDEWLNEQMGGTTLASLTVQCSGKAVLIQRGRIPFTNKINNAIASGASMILIYGDNINGDSQFSTIVPPPPVTIPIFTMGNTTGHLILSQLRSDKKLYASVEKPSYSKVDNSVRLRITELRTTPPSITYPLIVSGTLDQTTVLYNFTKTKDAPLIFYNTAVEQFSTTSSSPILLKYLLIANRQYRILDSIGQELAAPIMRNPISINPTITLSSPIYDTNTAISLNLRNQMTITASFATSIRFTNPVTNITIDGFDVVAAPSASILDIDTQEDNGTINRINYNERLIAIDLNTGNRITVNGNPTYEFVRYSCLLTGLTVTSTTLTFTSDKATVVDICKNPAAFVPDAPSLTPSIIAASNSIKISTLAPGPYGIYDATTPITRNSAGVATLGTFTKA